MRRLILFLLLALSACADAGRMPWESTRACVARQRMAGQSPLDAASICAPIYDAQGERMKGSDRCR
ncbi:hypothetical protein [Lichenicoccus sp.]|uniref:hypothetical protein n=1 Tax=Lichenicoccus sp. TaxID=2781899 RepID=UPI003D113318